MMNGKKVIVVMPAFNAAKTLKRTYDEIPRDTVDEVLLTDDGSTDGTLVVARELDMTVMAHDRNRGYGANQKTCYKSALARGAEIVVMLHPDYQYSPALIPEMAGLIADGSADIVLGSRMRGAEALRRGMPLYKFIGNRVLTAWQNLCLGQTLSEYHTGYRAYSKKTLESLPLSGYSDGFLFDNQILVDSIERGFKVGEVHCAARYEKDSSSIGFRKSVAYGLGVLRISAGALLRRMTDRRTLP